MSDYNETQYQDKVDKAEAAFTKAASAREKAINDLVTARTDSYPQDLKDEAQRVGVNPGNFDSAEGVQQAIDRQITDNPELQKQEQPEVAEQPTQSETVNNDSVTVPAADVAPVEQATE